jgi:hypothetical protein
MRPSPADSDSSTLRDFPRAIPPTVQLFWLIMKEMDPRRTPDGGDGSLDAVELTMAIEEAAAANGVLVG